MRAPPTSLLLLLLAGCASAPVRRVGEVREGDPWWPREEGRRIAYVGELRTPEHLGIERGFWASVWAFLTGEDEVTSLYRPTGVALASDGRLAVADPGRRSVRVYSASGREHRKLTGGLRYPMALAFVGELLVVADAETASLHGFDREGAPAPLPWELPALGRPAGLAVDGARRRLLVTDVGQHCVHVISLDGRAPRRFGTRGEGPGQLNFPGAVAVDAGGRVYVNDTLNFRVQVFSPELEPVLAFGAPGDGPGSLTRAKGLAVDDDGVVYVVEGYHDVVQAFDGQGRLLGVFGGNGTAPGRFWLPAGLALDTARHRLWVADTWNERVQVFALDGRTP
jgi:DNA-binding beta-propeller fold protein YncE